MLSKFSVKKPYTVIVGIVLILVLGIVSFQRMTTDLLPDMNMPYAIVITSYPGASPSQVEENVTKSVEQSMATVSNIQNVQSVSSENMSMVILEFSQSTNMDSVSLEMREHLDQISGTWDDAVGSPVIMKLNPDMMPVMVSALEKDGLDSTALTDYVENNVLSDVESLEGVASADASGEVESKIEVILRQDKIDEVNKKMQNAISGQFDEAQSELIDQTTALNDAQDQLDAGKTQLDAGKTQLKEKLSQASQAEAQIAQGEAQIEAAEAQLAQKEAELADAKDQLQTQRAAYAGGTFTKDDTYQAAYQPAYEAALAKAYEQADAQAVSEMEKQIATLKTQVEALKAQIAQAKEDGEATELLESQLAITQAALAQLDTDEARNQAKTAAENAAKLALDSSFPGEFDKQYAAKVIETLDSYLAQMQEGQTQLDTAKKQLADTKAQLNQGKISLAQAQSQINSAQIDATLQMADASTQLSLGQTQLDAGKQQLEQGQKTLEEQKETALSSADISDRLTADTIKQILMAQNFSMPAGYVTEDGVSYLVRVGDKFGSMEDMNNLVLMDPQIDGMDPVRLSDVAEVLQTDNSSEVYAKINGKDGVLLTIQKQTGYSTGEVSERLNAYYDKLMKNDSSIHVTNLMDQGIYIDMVVNSVLQNLAFGAIFAVLILFLFLRDIRPTAVVACSIPISLLTAIVLMYFSGISLNIISLSGLALGVGMLVDNSIVVIENIYRLHGLGLPVRKAAVQGAKQMTGAIVASTLTTICVFAPIVFTEGITRQLFVDMGLTIAYSLLASLLVAVTFVPMMASGLLKRKHKPKKSVFDWIGKHYEKSAYWALHHKILVLLGVLAVLLGSMYLCFSKGFSFMPTMESTQASVTVTMPGEATVEETGAMTDQVMDRLSGITDVEEIGAMVGNSSAMSMGGGGNKTNSATMYLILSEDKKLSGSELEKEVLDKTKDLDCEVAVSASMMDMSALGGSGVSVEIKGKDLDTLQKIAKDFAEIVSKIEGTTEVSDGMEETTQELRIVVNKSKAAAQNLTVAQVYQQIQAKLAQAGSATTLSTDTADLNVYVKDGEQADYTRDTVENFTITATGTDGTTKEIPVSEIVEFQDATGVDSIRRDSQSRYITVSAGVTEGHNVTLISDEVKKQIAKYEMPEGYSYKMTGEDATISDSMNDLVLMLLLALVFMYLIMVAQFQSLLSPFIVMFTIPLAFTGGFLGLLIAGSEMSIIAMIGFIMLCGIIVNNGIVLVDYTNQLRASGMEKHKAIVTAGKTRMRPILMTALTTILGLSTMAAGLGMGADMTQPMAIVTIGGLIYGTFLTLFVVPCIYDILNRRKYVIISDKELDAADEDFDIMKETNLIEESETGEIDKTAEEEEPEHLEDLQGKETGGEEHD
ncbi:MAG: efflux RND transporter permease subunit [Lachnospiraceae bacterium]|nr:efflux RND transporter permease subunit [Lachnospiraceae bacterium]